MSLNVIKTVIYLIICSMVTLIFILIYISGTATVPTEALMATSKAAFGDIIQFMGGVIGVLLVVVGFFITLYFNQQSKATGKLSDSIEKLSATISGMNAVILAYGTRIDGFEKRYEDHKIACEKIFNKHG